MLSTDVIRDANQLNTISDEWNQLLEASTSNNVFLTHEWLSTWWKHLSNGGTLHIVTVRDAGRLVGILPLGLRRPQYTRMTPSTLEFLGSGVIGSDYLDAIVQPDREDEVLDLMTRHLAAVCRPLQLSHLRSESCIAGRMTERLGSRRWTSSNDKINVCPFISLRGESWDAYLSSLGGSQRYNFNRRLKNLQKMPEYRFECARNETEAAQALDVLIHLHRKRWEGRAADSEAFQTPEIVAFHKEFAALAVRRGWLRLLSIWQGDTPAAALYGFRYGDTFYFYQSGFDPGFSKQSVGLVMMGLAIRSAIEEGALEYDLLHGDEEYKFHWARETRELGRIELFPPDVRGALFRRAINVNRAARRMAKRVLIRT